MYVQPGAQIPNISTSYTSPPLRFPRLLPILEPNYAVDRIMQAVLSNQRLLMMPRLLWVVYFAKGSVSQAPVGKYAVHTCTWFSNITHFSLL